jgi:hypothetical protein
MFRHALLAAVRGLRRASVSMLVLCIAGTAALAADADPPGRIARVNLVEGSGALQVGGVGDWSSELQGRPLAAGDRIWVAADSRAELHVGSSALRLGANTALQVLDVDDQNTRLALSSGSALVQIRTLAADEHFEISTPAGDIDIVHPGNYHLEVDEQGRRAYFAVIDGRADVGSGTERSSLDSGQAAELVAGGAPAIRPTGLRGSDDLDRWSADLDRRDQQSPAASYVSREVVGYQDLDGYGEWMIDPVYGPVWAPVVAADWAPYRLGYWSWIYPWGPTWIAAEPWGFAPYHYGRWVQVRHGWAWAPGPRGREQPTFHASPEYLRAPNLASAQLRHGENRRYIDERQRYDSPGTALPVKPVSVGSTSVLVRPAPPAVPHTTPVPAQPPVKIHDASQDIVRRPPTPPGHPDRQP